MVGSIMGIPLLPNRTVDSLEEALSFYSTIGGAVIIKPLDTHLLLSQARAGARIVTVEDGCAVGGFGSAVLEALAAAGLPGAIVLGFPDAVVGQGTQAELLADYGLDGPGIAARLMQ